MQAKLALKKSVGLYVRLIFLLRGGGSLKLTPFLTLHPFWNFFGLSEEDRTFVVRKLNNGLLREEWLMYSILSNHGI